MSSRAILSPWVRAALPEDTRHLFRLIPDDYHVELYGRSSRGPWQAIVKRGHHRELARMTMKSLDAVVRWAIETANADEVSHAH